MPRKRLILAFLVLLAASHAVRWFRSGAPEGRPGQSAIAISEIDKGQLTGRTVSLAFRDIPAARHDAPVLVMLHGSPGSSGQFDALIKEFDGEARLIIPDLPGFGASSREIADYSIEAHARYLADLLDALAIESAHLLGFSLGGGVALEFASLEPGKTASLILLGSIGVQELELLGDYTLNHAVHAFQLAALWLAMEGLPHFGYLDDTMLDISYARNFFDSDQRPLRGILESLEVPVLILHGESDFLVPVTAAREHARIVPQSELMVFDGGHFRLFTEADSLFHPVLDFLQRFESGEATTRSKASPERLAASLEPFDWERHGRPRPIGILPMGILLALGTLVSEDLTCIGAGILASRGAMPFWAGALACFAGIFLGDFLLYLAGRALGRGALRRVPFRWFLSEYQVERSAHFFHRHGPSLIFTTRFIPGTRLPTYFTAGLLGTGFWRFAGWFLFAAAVWTPLLVGFAAFLGGKMLTAFQYYEKFAFLGLIGVIVLLLVMIKIAFPLLNHRGRRILLCNWRRKTRWEFWPAWAIYPPVVIYILWRGLRHRSLTLFTAANPAIPGGGLADESKSRILEGFGSDVPEIAPFRLISCDLSIDAKTAAMDEFMAGENLDFPIVLKPDLGERGQGVGILDDRAAAVEFLRNCPLDVIAQEYVPGEEFGIFYYRYPEEERGRIFSITDKRLIGVTGDGVRTLEELILDDDRAVCMAPFFLHRFDSRLDEIPAEGENFRLTELGTHCRGALFLDGADLRSERLEDAFDVLSKKFDGFFFGRYDVRASSREDLKNGSGFKVLELNGVTSEATHIYDPRYGLLVAWKVLVTQWKIAFDIALQNVKKGVRPATIRETLTLIQRFRHRKRFEV